MNVTKKIAQKMVSFVMAFAISMTCFIPVGMKLLNVSADDLSDPNTQQAYEEMFTDLSFLDANDDFESMNYNLNNGIFTMELVKVYDGEELESLTDFYSIENHTEIIYDIIYDSNYSAVLVNVYIGSKNEENKLVKTIPGLLTHNPDGEKDIMITIEDNYYWLSQLRTLEDYPANYMSTYNFVDDLWSFCGFIADTIVDTLEDVVETVSEVVSKILHPVLEKTVDVFYAIAGDSYLEISAWLLNMETDTENQHPLTYAQFDCWQQYFGYMDLYDSVFDAGTSMRNAKMPIDTDDDEEDDYMLWAWKGDYLNLGAGAEMGIYTRWYYSDNIWLVDKRMAMTMTLRVYVDDIEIFYRVPEEPQWWITGFYTGYDTDKDGQRDFLDVDRDRIKAQYTVCFNDNPEYAFLYNELKKDFGRLEMEEWSYYDYSFNDTTKTFTFQF